MLIHAKNSRHTSQELSPVVNMENKPLYTFNRSN